MYPALLSLPRRLLPCQKFLPARRHPGMFVIYRPSITRHLFYTSIAGWAARISVRFIPFWIIIRRVTLSSSRFRLRLPAALLPFLRLLQRPAHPSMLALYRRSLLLMLLISTRGILLLSPLTRTPSLRHTIAASCHPYFYLCLPIKRLNGIFGALKRINPLGKRLKQSHNKQ